MWGSSEDLQPSEVHAHEDAPHAVGKHHNHGYGDLVQATKRTRDVANEACRRNT